MLASLARSHSDRCDGEEARRALEGVAEEILAVARLQGLLERSGRDGLSAHLEEMGPVWARIGTDLGVAISVDVADAPPISSALSLPLALITHEAVTACFRRALAEGGGSIRVSLGRAKDSICLAIIDDGTLSDPDLPDDDAPGCRLIHNLARLAHGRAHWRRNPLGGNVLSVIVPAAPHLSLVRAACWPGA